MVLVQTQDSLTLPTRLDKDYMNQAIATPNLACMPSFSTLSTIMEDQKQPRPKDVVLLEDAKEETPGKFTVHQVYKSYSSEFANHIERKLVRKIDLRLLPLLVAIYIFNYLDRNSITQARLYGLQKDLNVRGATYQTAISIFSAGYIAMQLPATLVMAKVRPSIFLVS